MARDYKNVTEAGLKAKQPKANKSSKQVKKKTGATHKSVVTRVSDNTIPGWMWLVSGVVIGGFVSFIVYLKLNVPIDTLTEGANKNIKAPIEKIESVGVKIPNPQQSTSDEKKSNRPEQNQFEFYDKLPNQHVILPENEGQEIENNHSKNVLPQNNKTVQESVKTNLNERTENNSKTRRYAYTLQVGSFLNFKDADKRKANLAMLGIGSRIHAIKMSGKTRYRVMVGPYEKIKQINEIDAAMKANNIQTLLLKERLY